MYKIWLVYVFNDSRTGVSNQHKKAFFTGQSVYDIFLNNGIHWSQKTICG